MSSNGNGTNGDISLLAVSRVESAVETATHHVDLAGVLAEITSDRWKPEITELRDAYASGGKDAADPLKKRLPGILWSGTFRKRAAGGLIHHSGLVHVDLDKLGDGTEGWRDHIAADPHTLACFISPTGTGLKVVYRCDPDRPHLESFKAAELHVLKNFGLVADPACKDVARLCFISWDPDAHINLKAPPLEYPPAPVEVEEPREPSQKRVDLPAGTISPGDDYDARGDWKAILTKHGWHPARENYWTRPGKKDGISASWNMVPAHPNRFYIFSSSADPFQAGHLYRPWHIFAMLECGGDYERAAHELGGLGFGTQRKPKVHGLDPDVQSRLDEEAERSFSTHHQPEPNLEDVSPEQLARLTAAYHQRLLADSPVGPAEPKKSAVEEWAPRRAGVGRVLRPEVPTIFLKGIPVFNRGNIGVITALQKSGKSAVGGAIIGAIIAGKEPQGDTLGFSAHNEFNQAVLHLDTEQSPQDHEALIATAKRRAGAPETPPWLYSYGVKGIAVDVLNKTVVRLLAELKVAHGGIFVALLDGVADFVTDTNDPKDCNPFVTQLEAIATDFDCSVLGILHLNPSPGGVPTKSRGHLGSQLERKCETDLRLVKDTEGVTTVYTASARHAPIFERDGQRFNWDTSDGMHRALAGTGRAVRDEAEFDALRELATDCFAETKRMRYAELVTAVANIARCKDRSAQEKVMRMKQLNIICKNLLSLWELGK